MFLRDKKNPLTLSQQYRELKKTMHLSDGNDTPMNADRAQAATLDFQYSVPGSKLTDQKRQMSPTFLENSNS